MSTPTPSQSTSALDRAFAARQENFRIWREAAIGIMPSSLKDALDDMVASAHQAIGDGQGDDLSSIASCIKDLFAEAEGYGVPDCGYLLDGRAYTSSARLPVNSDGIEAIVDTMEALLPEEVFRACQAFESAIYSNWWRVFQVFEESGLGQLEIFAEDGKSFIYMSLIPGLRWPVGNFVDRDGRNCPGWLEIKSSLTGRPYRTLRELKADLEGMAASIASKRDERHEKLMGRLRATFPGASTKPATSGE